MPDTVDPYLVSVLFRRREMLEQGHDPTPEELCRDYPERLAEVREAIHLSDKGEGWIASRETPAGGETGPYVPMASLPVPEWAEFGSRLLNVRHHAQGGMGEVLLADDPDLGSAVVVKVIHANLLGRPDMVARFLWEARVTANLNHPGIPPVHGIGRTADGRPCYTMRFIAGRELSEPIVELHRTGTGLRELLAHFISTCQTVAYAHGQGVIHRDLKPRNIRIGEFGETIVLDWGLAKQHGEAPPGTDERGSVLGTFGYMAPEQKDGRQEDVDARSDVYSLGVILQNIIGKQGPKPLAAIVAHATERLPNRRYQTAMALSEDVAHWIADEPVSVHPDSVPVRIARRARKYPILTTALTVAVIALAIGVPVLWQQQAKTARERDDKDKARQAAEASEVVANQAKEKAVREKNEKEIARKAEETGRKRLWLAIEETIKTIRPLLETQQQLRKADHDFLEVVLLLSERGAEAAPNDLDSQEKKAWVYHEIAYMQQRMGNRPAAMIAYEKAIAIREKLCKASPADRIFRHNLAGSWNDLGNVLLEENRLKDALDATQAALKEQKTLLETNPKDAAIRHEVGMSYNHLGLVYRQLGRPTDAEKSFQEAIRILVAVTADEPANPRFRETLAHAIHNRSKLFLDRGHFKEALADLREAVSHYERIGGNETDRHETSFQKSSTLRSIASLSAALGRFDEAEKVGREAMEIQARVFAAAPGPTAHRAEYAETLFRMGIILQTLGRHSEMEKTLRTILKLIDESGKKKSPADDRQGGSIQMILGMCLGELGKDQEALVEYDRSLARLAALQDRKVDTETRHLQCAILIQRAIALHRLKRQSDSVNDLARAAKLSEDGNPARDFERAVALVRIGQMKQGLEETEHLLDPKTRSAEGKPIAPQKWFYAALVYVRAFEAAGVSAEAEKYAAHAIELLRKALEDGVFRNFDDLWLFRTDENLNPIRARDDFKQFVKELDAELNRARI